MFGVWMRLLQAGRRQRAVAGRRQPVDRSGICAGKPQPAASMPIGWCSRRVCPTPITSRATGSPTCFSIRFRSTAARRRATRCGRACRSSRCPGTPSRRACPRAFLNAIGLPELAVPTPAEYEALALRLARDRGARRRQGPAGRQPRDPSAVRHHALSPATSRRPMRICGIVIARRAAGGLCGARHRLNHQAKGRAGSDRRALRRAPRHRRIRDRHVIGREPRPLPRDDRPKGRLEVAGEPGGVEQRRAPRCRRALASPASGRPGRGRAATRGRGSPAASRSRGRPFRRRPGCWRTRATRKSRRRARPAARRPTRDRSRSCARRTESSRARGPPWRAGRDAPSGCPSTPRRSGAPGSIARGARRGRARRALPHLAGIRQPQHGSLDLRQQPQPAIEHLRRHLARLVERAEHEGVLRQAERGARRRRADRQPVVGRRVDVRQADDLFRRISPPRRRRPAPRRQRRSRSTALPSSRRSRAIGPGWAPAAPRESGCGCRRSSRARSTTMSHASSAMRRAASGERQARTDTNAFERVFDAALQLARLAAACSRSR